MSEQDVEVIQHHLQEKTELFEQYTKEQTRNIALNEANKLISADNQDKSESLLEAQHAVTTIHDNLTHIAARLNLPYDGINTEELTNTCLETIKQLHHDLEEKAHLVAVLSAPTVRPHEATPRTLRQRIKGFLLVRT